MKSDLNSTKSNDISSRISAIVAGFGLLIMAILAPIANFGVLQKAFETNQLHAQMMLSLNAFNRWMEYWIVYLKNRN